MVNKALHARLETPVFAVARRRLVGYLAGTLICINVSFAQKTNIFRTELRLTSAAFDRDGKIPTHFTCDGANVSPHLAWSDPPAETRSFAIVCSDPDAPSGIWYHRAIFDIPASTIELAENFPPKSAMGRQAINDFGTLGYGGPCPPRGHGTHHYHFTLYALNVEHLGVAVGARCRNVEKAAKAHAIATAKLIGVYTR